MPTTRPVRVEHRPARGAPAHLRPQRVDLADDARCVRRCRPLGVRVPRTRAPPTHRPSSPGKPASTAGVARPTVGSPAAAAAPRAPERRGPRRHGGGRRRRPGPRAAAPVPRTLTARCRLRRRRGRWSRRARTTTHPAAAHLRPVTQSRLGSHVDDRPEAAATSGSPASAASGAATGTMGSGPSPSNTRGKPPRSRAAVTSSTRRPADGGTSSSTAVTTAERARSSRAPGGPPTRTAPATTHSDEHGGHEHRHEAERGVDGPGSRDAHRVADPAGEQEHERLAEHGGGRGRRRRGRGPRGGHRQMPSRSSRRPGTTRIARKAPPTSPTRPSTADERSPGATRSTRRAPRRRTSARSSRTATRSLLHPAHPRRHDPVGQRPLHASSSQGSASPDELEEAAEQHRREAPHEEPVDLEARPPVGAEDRR